MIYFLVYMLCGALTELWILPHIEALSEERDDTPLQLAVFLVTCILVWPFFFTCKVINLLIRVRQAMRKS